jgi:hypothetical protein
LGWGRGVEEVAGIGDAGKAEGGEAEEVKGGGLPLTLSIVFIF